MKIHTDINSQNNVDLIKLCHRPTKLQMIACIAPLTQSSAIEFHESKELSIEFEDTKEMDDLINILVEYRNRINREIGIRSIDCNLVPVIKNGELGIYNRRTNE